MIKTTNVFQRLNAARLAFHQLELKKSGTFPNRPAKYFELGDFLIPALSTMDAAGLATTPITFIDGIAKMDIVNLDDPADRISVESPMGSASLKGCHEVQNIGAVQTYQRRYLWFLVLEIAEHDALDVAEENKPAADPELIEAIEDYCEELGEGTKERVQTAYKVSSLYLLNTEQAEAAARRLKLQAAAVKAKKEKADV